MSDPTLYIFSGLPGTGKSTLAKRLAKHVNATFVRVDAIEQGLRDLCKMETIFAQGYQLGYLIALDNLKIGNDVIADSVNPLGLTRKEWRSVASSVGAKFLEIEVACSDKYEHRRRIEERDSDIENLMLPSWSDVENREYEEWIGPRILIETAGKSIDDCVKVLLKELSISP